MNVALLTSTAVLGWAKRLTQILDFSFLFPSKLSSLKVFFQINSRAGRIYLFIFLFLVVVKFPLYELWIVG